jgi:serine phosphatase RsbU (regulator of sigma subunit)
MPAKAASKSSEPRAAKVGVVEATSRTGDEPFGFARLEQTLSRHSLESVVALRDGVLRDLGRFTGPAPRQDDQTLLVLRVSA